MNKLTNNKDMYMYGQNKWGKNANDNLLVYEKYILEKYICETNKKIIEAGCGGGRISFSLQRAGYKHIDAFDFCEDFIKNAKMENLKAGNPIHFFLADATNLSMIEDATYDYSIYLQQIICFVPRNRIKRALEESYRITKPGGIVIFSFLNYDGRRINKLLSPILFILRKVRREDKNKQELPWLKVDGKINYLCLCKNQATNYWFKFEQVITLLTKVGYEIKATYYESQFTNSKEKGAMYIVCEKRNQTNL